MNKENKNLTISLSNALKIKTNLIIEISILETAIASAKREHRLSLATKLGELLQETKQKLLELDESMTDATIQTTNKIHNESVNLD